MKHVVLIELGRLWVVVLLLLGWASGILAAEGPAVRGSTVGLGPGGTISFQFEAQAGAVETFRLQFASELKEGAAWTVENRATIAESIQGLYEVTAPADRGARASFYRVAAFSGPVAPLFINEVMSGNLSTIADSAGAYWDWIEIFNQSDEAVELQGYGLSDDASRPQQWTFPSTLIQPGSYVLVFASGLDRRELGKDLHASFKLDPGGEQLWLTAPDGRTVDQVQVPALQGDQSAGRRPDGSELWVVYSKALATPRWANSDPAVGPVIEPPQFTLAENFFPAGTVLSLGFKPTAAGQTIRYTTNGAPVTSASLVFSAPLALKQTTVVRAAMFEGARLSAETVRTFFVGAGHGLPVISLAALPSHFEFRNGYLYGMGDSVFNSSGQVRQNFPFNGSNAWQDREVEVSIEFYEPGQQLGFQQRAGLKIHGGWGSRGYPQKAFALFARQKYGQGKIKHRIFPDKPIDAFETVLLRSSGNDNQSTHQTAPRPPITAFGPAPAYGSYFVNGSFTLLRDAMMQRLLKDVELDTQAYRPAVVYINGDYWGIYNLREKMNEDYVVTNHGLEKGQVDLIEGYGSVAAGDGIVNAAMRDYVATRDMRNAANYAFVEGNYVEIANFIDYHLAVIYFQNFDIGNIRSWRPRTPKGRFRWMVFDQDYGFNLWKPEVYLPAMARDYADYDNMFKFYTAGTGTGTGWPNDGGRTLLLRRLLANDSFKQRFIQRCADLLNGPFREETVVSTIEQMAAVIRPEIPQHLQRWSWAQLRQRGFGLPHQAEYEPFTRETWEKNLQVLVDFGRKRPAKLRQDCIKHFGLTNGVAEVTVQVEPAFAGHVRFGSLALQTFPWSGTCFRTYAVALRAVSLPGYRFVGWSSGEAASDHPRWDARLGSTNVNLTARFEPLAQIPPGTPGIILNEVQYHPAADQESGDWVELHNRGNAAVNLGGWVLRDDNDYSGFLLPETTVPAGGYLVLCQDTAKFNRVYPGVANLVGNFVFGLDNSGDTVRLFDPTGNLMLRITYGDEAPWPPEADGTGHTLQLREFESYSAEPSSWTSSPSVGGTPGKANP